ncbi:hypothetical protein DSO57_1025768 [Entomophthora muscae]|uniref:Uncharacterized protein n=1 Tax=Entomophthora muscae TaxID=34485 RepID=A0ACC2RT69_9FUNG|nr:hypothetical protein DSO57_1025768 [Entomophthora muscae]
MGENPIKLMYLLNDLKCRTHNILSVEENLVKSLTSDNVETPLLTPVPESCLVEESLVLIPIVVEEYFLHQDLSVLPELSPKVTSWLMTSMLLMKLDSYLPQLSPTLSLWTPV